MMKVDKRDEDVVLNDPPSGGFEATSPALKRVRRLLCNVDPEK